MEGIKHLVVALVFVVYCSAEMTRLYNTGNAIGTITSSTLAWASLSKGEKVPENAVPVGTGGPLWCRSFVHGIWLSGALKEGNCRVPFFGKVEANNEFQILISINGSARLVNVPWDSLEALPPNPVSTPNMLLALSNDSERGTVLPGYVNPKERRAHFLKGEMSLKLTGGFLVTEVEPIKYELSDFVLDDKAKKSVHDEVLQEFILENPTDFPDEVSYEVNFVAPHNTYFGKVKGTLTGLPAKVSGPDTIPVNITWGINNQLDEEKTHSVIYKLPPQTEVNVQLIAEVRIVDGAYGGYLTSFYEDNKRLRRRIAGLHMERRLARLRADFSQVRSLVDGSLVEELPEQSTVLLHSSTTTPPPVLVADASENIYLPRPEHNINDVNAAPSLFSSISLLIISLTGYLICK